MAYTREQLLERGPQPERRGRHLDEIAFPLGGIGTGSISLGGWGQLRDWEIRNRPAKGFHPPQTFFTIKVQEGKKPPVTRVLQGPAGGPRVAGGHSAPTGLGQGLPHFREVSFRGEFPLATVTLSDPTMPVTVVLEATNPFIPLNDRDSSLPVAILRYQVTNTGGQPLQVTLFGNLANIIGPREGRVNEARTRDGLTGLCLSNAQCAPETPEYGTLVLATPCPNAVVWPRWKEDRLAKWWEAVAWSEQFPPEGEGTSDNGTLAVCLTLNPGETATVPFYLAWHFPIFEHWNKPECNCTPARWRNYYATQWSDAWAVAAYTHENCDRLWGETQRFHDALFASTLPTYVLDAISSQLSTLKTTTCLRLEDGTFYGFEGCSDTSGCCEGSCTHVWNYAQALPYLFPALQRSMLEANWTHSMGEDGFVTFRMPLPLGTRAQPTFHPAADGQMGTVMQFYREWLLCGDTDWLRRLWPTARRALEFAWRYWDADRDGVMEGMQHNTYDIEFYGPNTMMGSLYLGALRAAAEIARVLGDHAKAEEYTTLFTKGSAWTDAHLFNGEYYEQQVNPTAHEPWPEPLRNLALTHGRDDRYDWPKWQFGTGCIADQLIGQWYAQMLGLGYLYEPQKVRHALRSIFRHNWREHLHDHPNLLRVYAMNDEAGLLIGTWPRGGRPGYPFYFADEVWPGIEYQVASHLISEGMLEEGLSIVKGVRDRHTGEYRNPWNEIECGHHYARSMASYALLLALSGFHYSAPNQHLRFAPRLFADDFRAFFCVASGWGTYHQQADENGTRLTLEVCSGSLTLRDLTVAPVAARPQALEVTLGQQAVDAAIKVKQGADTLTFATPIRVTPEAPLRITLA